MLHRGGAMMIALRVWRQGPPAPPRVRGVARSNRERERGREDNRWRGCPPALRFGSNVCAGL
eukprot:6140786-Pyramimonas_sp.AAC.2